MTAFEMPPSKPQVNQCPAIELYFVWNILKALWEENMFILLSRIRDCPRPIQVIRNQTCESWLYFYCI